MLRIVALVLLFISIEGKQSSCYTDNEPYAPILPTNCTMADGDQLTFETLKSIYYSTDGDHWTINTNWFTNQSYCSWAGVQCDNTCRVVGLNLVNNKLRGLLPPSFSNLQDLIGVQLYCNYLTGGLEYIETLESLQNLALDTNPWNCKIPVIWNTLTNLQAVTISHGGIIGIIPGFLLYHPKIWYLNFQANNILTFEYPNQRHNSSMQVLYFDLNPRLSGDLGIVTNNMRLLRTLTATACNFTGPLPDLYLPSLADLELANNYYTGEIPDSWSSLSSLSTIDLHNNRLTGGLRVIALNDNITKILVANNKFHDHLDSFGYQVQMLELQNNNFTGTIYAGAMSLVNITGNPFMRLNAIYLDDLTPVSDAIALHTNYYCYAVYFWDTLLFCDPEYYYYSQCYCYKNGNPPHCQ